MANLRKTVFLFSGQGTQYSMMGKNLYIHNKEYQEIFDECDRYIQTVVPFSMAERLYNEQHDMQKEKLIVSNLALFCMQYALARTLIHYGAQPDYVCGTSLGEFVATAVAYPEQLETIIRLLIKLSVLLQEKINKSSMISVIAPVTEETERLLKTYHVELAARNFKGNYVIAGSNEDIDKIITSYQAEQTAFYRLPVPMGFHSYAIDFAKRGFFDGVEELLIDGKSQIKIVSSLLHSETDKITVEYLWNCIRRTIEFETTVEYMEGQGGTDYVDLSPSGMMSLFIKHNLNSYSSSSIHQILWKQDSYQGLEEYLKVVHKNE